MAVPINVPFSVMLTTSPDFQCCTEEPSVLATEPVIFAVPVVDAVNVGTLIAVVNVSFTGPLLELLFGGATTPPLNTT